MNFGKNFEDFFMMTLFTKMSYIYDQKKELEIKAIDLNVTLKFSNLKNFVINYSN